MNCMKKNNGVIAVYDKRVYDEYIYLVDVFNDMKLFKSLSLLLAYNNSIPVLPTMVLINYNDEFVRRFVCDWGLPIMIRMDYSSLPPEKPLGGIPITDIDVLYKVSLFLYQKKCLPILHPNVERNEDLYSLGVLIRRDNDNIIIEMVGEGFDASDLRLGVINPQEIIEYDLREGAILRRNVISENEYAEQKVIRTKRINAYTEYKKYVNRTGSMLANINKFMIEGDGEFSKIPDKYKRISNVLLKELIDYIYIIKSRVIMMLPYSDLYVASFSYSGEYGWILWDVYGSWYKR